MMFGLLDQGLPNGSLRLTFPLVSLAKIATISLATMMSTAVVIGAAFEEDIVKMLWMAGEKWQEKSDEQEVRESEKKKKKNWRIEEQRGQSKD